MSKQGLGQFYTTNFSHILQNLSIPPTVLHIIEPFAGKGDLFSFIPQTVKNLECYDIDPKNLCVIQRDTLLNPPNYVNTFVLTNPPYLARNKSKNKTIFDKYGQNDLYKCFLDELTRNVCIGGIVIIPLNFWCSIRVNDVQLRKRFLDIYNVITLNIFEEQVFDDTSYSVCSFQFELKKNDQTNQICCHIYPSQYKSTFIPDVKNNFSIGGEIYNLEQNPNIKVGRLTKQNKDSEFSTNILVKCIDDNLDSQIRLSLVNDKDKYIYI